MRNFPKDELSIYESARAVVDAALLRCETPSQNLRKELIECLSEDALLTSFLFSREFIRDINDDTSGKN